MHDIKNTCWKDTVWKDMMKIGQLRQEETSSGYGSRESLAEGILIANKQNDVAVVEQLNNNNSNNTCSCKRTGNNRKVSSSKGSKLSNSTAHTHESDNSAKKSYKHSQSSLPGTLEHETLAQINESLISQNQQLTEQNHALLEELQISRRFFEGTLTDLSAQLSTAESKIKILQETVSTYEEALAQRKANSESVVLKNVDKLTTDVHEDDRFSVGSNVSPKKPNDKCDELITNKPPVSVVGVRKCRKSSASGDQKKQIAKPTMTTPTMTTAPVTSPTVTSPTATPPTIKAVSNLDSKIPKISSFQGRNFAKMKEQLLEINQCLKTDIEILKCKAMIPQPTLDSAHTRENEEQKPCNTVDKKVEEDKENSIVKKKRIVTDGSPRHGSSRRLPTRESKRTEKKTKSDDNGSDIVEQKPSLISYLPRDGSLTLEDHKERLSEEYSGTPTSSSTSPLQSPKKEVSRIKKLARRNSKSLEYNDTTSPVETNESSEDVR